MNRGDSDATKSQSTELWCQPLLFPSRGDNDGQETAIMPSLHSLDRSRLKRSRGDAQEMQSGISATILPSSQLKPVFSIQSLSLDRGAIAPALASPTAPFARSERKKAYVSALFYSECFHRKIQPVDADSASFDIQNQYTKWWVDAKKKQTCTPTDAGSGSSPEEDNPSSKKRRLPDPNSEKCDSGMIVSSSLRPYLTQEMVTLLKDRFIEQLQKTGGDTTTAEFQRCLEQLRSVYVSGFPGSSYTNRKSHLCGAHGTWLTLSKPTYSECLGRNENGESIYTLGRMSFDMFRPSNLRCSIRAVMNNVRVMDPKSKPPSFPHRLAKELKQHRGRKSHNPIHHYDIVVAFTIEANQTRNGTEPKTADASHGDDEFVVTRPIRGLMTNHGYMVADPKCPNRMSIWFTGGSMEVQDEVADAEIWKQIFDESLAPSRDLKAMANLLAAKVLLGAYTTTTSVDSNTGNSITTNDVEDHPPSPSSTSTCSNESNDDSAPIMSYFFKRPIGGHGEVYCDTLYIDENLRIMQGHHGSTYVFTKVPDC
ncbi:expressed unknown protein [Seminavis robusta]|uniref:Uncharacterized protein n=1 Tax=Seminavis robusta TaxID=568900 RepID=A0A9N8EAG3_9STRA|nr:expressed unknown protein [Seminavis robusta]|eukprot:Sro675_g185540.1 n/a (538) ;mRNA; r:37599-39292